MRTILPMLCLVACMPVKSSYLRDDGADSIRTVAFKDNPWLKENNDQDADGSAAR